MIRFQIINYNTEIKKFLRENFLFSWIRTSDKEKNEKDFKSICNRQLLRLNSNITNYSWVDLYLDSFKTFTEDEKAHIKLLCDMCKNNFIFLYNGKENKVVEFLRKELKINIVCLDLKDENSINSFKEYFSKYLK